MIMPREYGEVTKLVRADARWQAAMRRRRITDFEKVDIDPWSAPADPTGHRMMRALSFYAGENRLAYNRPIEGVIANIDLTLGKVVGVDDTGVVPLAPRGWDYDAKSLGPLRPALPPLLVSQPAGPAFQVSGQEVSWQGWRFCFGLREHDGLVLYQVGYEEGGKVRPVLYRASISEMIVPYGDPDPSWAWRSAFDVGEYGFGQLTTSLQPGGDVPTTARLFDAALADGVGKPFIIPRAVGLYERDGGVLWKHSEAEVNNVRRARELCLAQNCVIGNYDYLLQWIFHQDGTLEFDAGLTGILLGKGTTMTRDPKELACDGCTGHLVGEHVLAPNHQHFFNFRLDFDVDGPRNSLLETNVASLPAGPSNVSGVGFAMRETLLAREQEAQRDIDLAQQRSWRVINPGVRNAHGNFSGYMLMPGANTPPYQLADSEPRHRAAFLSHHLWATQYREDELYAAGQFTNLTSVDHGLSIWTKANRPIQNEDLVLWYTMGVTHLPREEEWPIMTTHHAGFRLMPAGFFVQNPALDVPPP